MLPYAKPSEIGLDAQRLQVAYDLLEKWTSGPVPDVPGGVIAVGRHGKLVEPRFFGRQSPEADAPPIRRDAMFVLASLSKPITYLGAMQMVERGLFNLSDKVTRHIPDFAAHHKEETLVQHLFTHTSGMPDMLENNAALRKMHAPLSAFITAAIRDTVPLFPPGTSYSYQSMGTLVAAELIQRLSGLTIRDYLKREVFDPLGLKATTLGSRGFDRERIVRLQTPAYQAPSFGWNSPYWHELGAPWGGLISTPDEFAVLCQLMLNGGEYRGTRLLAPETVRRMTTNRMEDHPDLPDSIRRKHRWGLGWKLNSPTQEDTLGDLLSSRAYGHLGSTGNLFWIDPERDGFCILFTSAERARAPWRLVHLSNAVSAAFV